MDMITCENGNEVVSCSKRKKKFPTLHRLGASKECCRTSAIDYLNRLHVTCLNFRAWAIFPTLQCSETRLTVPCT